MSECPVQKNSSKNSKDGDADTSESGSGCPIKNFSTSTGGDSPTTPFSLYYLLRPWIGAGASKSAPSSSSNSGGKKEDVRILGYNEAANDAHFDPTAKFPGQKIELSQKRTVSNIPKSEFTPKHQPDGVNKWVYPSEQQYYNAMKRKGYEPPEEDMSVILTIHNTVNELGWSSILEWEAMRGCKNPKLKRFMGRPKDLSPKARFLVFLGKEAPFDRHDWVVDRDGKEVRYVIDFYAISGSAGRTAHGQPPVHLDVRPALDSTGAFLDRVQWTVSKWLNI